MVLAGSFLLILLFNYWTPMFSDDYTYGAEVHQAGSLADLIRQEHEQYMTWNGRSVVHLLLRISLAMPEILFKIVNSLAFVALTFLIYANVEGKKTCDSRLLVLITLLVWLFGVDFAQTVLWQTGACNYLWGMVLILSMLTLGRREYKRTAGGGRNQSKVLLTILKAALLCLLGVIAGWCNENTSGALVLVLLGLNLSLWIRKRQFSLPLTVGLAGSVIGLYLMVSAPGNANRAQYAEENYSGLAAYVARFEKIVVVMEQYFFVLLGAFSVLLVIRLLQERAGGSKERLRQVQRPLSWLVLSLITSYALVLTPSAMPRAHFGAGIFLILGICQLAVDVVRAESETSSFLGRALVYAAFSVLCLRFLFVYIEDGTNLFRIHRDCTERVDYIIAQKATGAESITVAQVHPAFYNTYSAIEIMDLKEDPTYWTNVGFEQYYEVEEIIAVPYDEWATSRKETQE